MILDFCARHRDSLGVDATAAALSNTRRLLLTERAPHGLSASTIHSVVVSSLFAAMQDGGRAVEGHLVDRIDALPPPPPAEYARLISKGRLLYEHCMVEISSACVIGFLDHELRKTHAARILVFDLLGWIFEQRILLAESRPREDDPEFSARIAQSDYMLDLGVSLVHGLRRDVAKRLASDKEP